MQDEINMQVGFFKKISRKILEKSTKFIKNKKKSAKTWKNSEMFEENMKKAYFSRADLQKKVQF